MPSQLDARIEERRTLAESVRGTDRILMPMLLEHSQAARAIWDLGRGDQGPDALVLILTDPRGSAAGDFTPTELHDEGKLRRRFSAMIGEMAPPRRSREARVRIELRDAFVPTQQLEQFRLNLGQVPDIEQARLVLHNQVRLLPQRPDNYLLTDFAIEVNRPFEQVVREVVAACGFQVRDDPRLIDREGVRKALARLVEQHRRDGEPAPEFALCFQLQDRETVHLLEVATEVPELGDSSLDGIGFAARGLIPHAHLLKIYLSHPNDLVLAAQDNRDHPLFEDCATTDVRFSTPTTRARRSGNGSRLW